MDHASSSSCLLARALENHRVLGMLAPPTRSSLSKALIPVQASAGERLTGGERDSFSVLRFLGRLRYPER